MVRVDWVSLKVDAVHEEVWRAIDRPHSRLRLAAGLDGLQEFARCFSGRLVTETMLVESRNDASDELEALAEFLARLGPATAYLAVPTRPPAESWARAPTEQALTRAHQSLEHPYSPGGAAHRQRGNRLREHRTGGSGTTKPQSTE